MSKDELGYRPCVGLMVINSKGQVWIGRRAGKANDAVRGDVSEVPPMWWQMPQGGIDEGENALEAAYRELFEETGIRSADVSVLGESADWHTYDLPPELVGKVWKGRYRGQKQKWFAFRFSGQDADVNITPDDPEMIEFDQWRWADVEELLELIIPFKRGVYEAVLAELGQFAAAAE